jgi:hypothetical protein
MGREYSMHGRDEKYIKMLVREPEGKRPLEYLSVDGRITSKIGWEGVDWIHVIQDSNLTE